MVPPVTGTTAAEGVAAITTESTIVTSTTEDDAERKVTDDIFADLDFNDQAFMFSGQDDLLVAGVREPLNAITLGELLNEQQTELKRVKLEDKARSAQAPHCSSSVRDFIIKLRPSAPSAVEVVEIPEDDPIDDTPGDDQHESHQKRRRRHRH